MKYSYCLLALALMAQASFSADNYLDETVFEHTGKTSVQNYTIKALLKGTLRHLEIREYEGAIWFTADFKCEWPTWYSVLPDIHKRSGHVSKKVEAPYRANSIHLNKICGQERPFFLLPKRGHTVSNFDRVIKDERNAMVMIKGVTLEITDSLNTVLQEIKKSSSKEHILLMGKRDFDNLKTQWKKDKQDQIDKIMAAPDISSWLRSQKKVNIERTTNDKINSLTVLEELPKTYEYRIKVLATIEITKQVEDKSFIKVLYDRDQDALNLNWLDANGNHLVLERQGQRLIATVYHGKNITYSKYSNLSNKKRITEQLSDLLTPSGFDLGSMIDGDITYLNNSIAACQAENQRINSAN